MWLLFAALASMFWGMSYAISEQVYRYASIYTTLAIDTLILSVLFFIAAARLGYLKSDIAAMTSSPRNFWLVVGGIVIFAAAELFIALSITNKSATLSGLIEISYPLFIALFAYLCFGESQLNLGTAVGGALIFFGVATVYAFSR